MSTKKVILGKIPEDFYKELEKERKPYQPFLMDFESTWAFKRWLKTAVKPIIKGKWSVLITEKINFEVFLDNYKELIETDIEYVDIIYNVIEKNRFVNIEIIEDKNMPIERNTKWIVENFKERLDKVLDLHSHKLVEEKDKLINNIIRKIGYSNSTLEAYMPELLASPKISIYYINKIFPQRKLPKLEYVLYGVLKKDKIQLRNHYLWAERYSMGWLIEQYKDILYNSLNLRKKIRNKEMKFEDIRKDIKTVSMINIIRDIPTINLYLLLKLIRENDETAIEKYCLISPIYYIQMLDEEFSVNFDVRTKNNIVIDF